MPGAKYTQTYQKVSAMGEKLKAAGKQGPSNDEQLKLYAYAKVAEGKDINDAKKPGMFDLAVCSRMPSLLLRILRRDIPPTYHFPYPHSPGNFEQPCSDTN
ncbi:Galactose-1-phosphate uridylyltransferase [Alternaria alternata]|nr:Galactose-1-phosphate uridylyltransferase [Alternaria alternata]